MLPCGTGVRSKLRTSGLTPEDCETLFAALGGYNVLILAVSGGPDSLALLTLISAWAEARNKNAQPLPCPRFLAVTIDHGVRSESASEAAFVEAQAARWGVPHETLPWLGEKPLTGFQEAAREARYTLLAARARREDGTVAVVTAHHRDDQVETFLMRLGRGSGLDGLSAMRSRSVLGGGRLAHDGLPLDDLMFGGQSLNNLPVDARVYLERPFLDVPKVRLIATLEDQGLPWIADPSNDNPTFERVRLRQAQQQLDHLGVGSAAIARSVRRLQRGKDALDWATERLWQSAVATHAGAYGAVNIPLYSSAPEDLRVRVLARLIQTFGGQTFGARLSHIEALAVRGHPGARPFACTLGGCFVRYGRRILHVFREPGRLGLPVLSLAPGATALWDCRFLVTHRGNNPSPVEVRALGAAATRVRVLASSSMPYAAAMTLPSFWRHDKLLAVPHFGPLPGSDFGSGEEAAQFTAVVASPK